MTEMNTQQAIKWIAELFEEEPDQVTEESSRDDLEYWDSMGMLSLMAELDTEFNIVLEEKQLSELSSVRDLLTLMREHKVICD